jgi:dTDP-4-amino-4,6-dideoxygalactose transaminase
MIYLADQGIGSFAMYPMLVPLQPAYAHLGYSEADFPVSAPYARRVLNLPMFETLREDEAQRTCEAILSFYNKKA